MVFVQFTTANGSTVGSVGEKRYFVGKDWPSVFADTKGGTEFGFTKLENRRMVTEEEARKGVDEKNLRFLEDGIKSVQSGTSDSYLIQ
jgi:hypothetical protein